MFEASRRTGAGASWPGVPSRGLFRRSGENVRGLAGWGSELEQMDAVTRAQVTQEHGIKHTGNGWTSTEQHPRNEDVPMEWEGGPPQVPSQCSTPRPGLHAQSIPNRQTFSCLLRCSGHCAAGRLCCGQNTA